MITKDDYIQVINQLITQPKETWKNDPFEELVKNCPKDIVEKYVTTLPEDVTPSTSEDVRTVNFDARVQYSQILGGVYLDVCFYFYFQFLVLILILKMKNHENDEFQLSSYLKSQRDKSSDEYHLCHFKTWPYQKLIQSSLAGIIPFLEPGVGLGAAARSTFIKSWKVYDGNKEACREKLIFAAKVIQALLSCNDAITVQFLPKFIDDVICVRFQLLELGVDEYDSEIENILEKCPIDIYFGSLMFLTQDKKGKLTPKWFKVRF
uniref:Uncharacterized protein n=1 Tax=Caenorhabditis japonica TaxID=281687 RepID=A0A8R1EGZ0_CAEJA